MPDKKRRNWSREEVLVAFNLYCRTPFGKIDDEGNPKIIRLAELLQRSPGAVAMKMFNLAHYDPVHATRNVSGLGHTSKIDKQIWEEFDESSTKILLESDLLLEALEKQAQGEVFDVLKDISDTLKNLGSIKTGERARIAKEREGQDFFREMMLATYASKCCITGIHIPKLLDASHIKPWAADSEDRLNPRNGLLLNALHHRAFDKGLMTITKEYKVKVSNQLRGRVEDKRKCTFFDEYDGKDIRLPENKKFRPNGDFLDYHRNNIFEQV